MGAAMGIMAAGLLFAWLRIWPETPDGLIHLQRVRALAEAVQAGVFNPRWFPDFAFGYGHPILYYYAPLSYAPAALLHLLGIPLIPAVTITLALLFGGSGWAMFALLRTGVHRPAALFGTVVYLCFPYRFYDLFVRGALPEFAAFFWLPLIGLGLVAGANQLTSPTPSRHNHGRGLIGSALALSGLIITHNLSALMAATSLLLLTPLAFLSGRKGDASRAWLKTPILIIGIIGLAALVSGWYAIPALLDAHWVGIGSTPPAFGYTNHFATWRQLFAWTPTALLPAAQLPVVPVPGWVLLSLLAAGPALVGPLPQRLRICLTSGLLLTISALLLMSQLSAPLWQLAAPVLGKLQFPWRWQTVIALGSALLAAGLVERWELWRAQQKRRPTLTWWLVAAASLLLLVNVDRGLRVTPASFTSAAVTAEQMWARDAANGQVGATWTGEFLPIWVTEERWAIGRAPSDGADAMNLPATTLTATPLRRSYLATEYRVTALEASELILHQFYFPAWRIRVDDQPATVAPVSNLGLTAVSIPPGEHIVHVQWRPTRAVTWGRSATAGGWLLIGFILLRGRRRQSAAPPARWSAETLWVGAWLAVGLFALVGAAGITARTHRPAPIEADFGPVRLESAAAPTAHAGSTAAIELTWLIQAPTAGLIAFVHVVDAQGVVVAQQDELLAGAYTPPERWLPGLLLTHRHLISLPMALPPGRYQLKAGLYAPGNPDAPLWAEGADAPRIDIGWLEVVP